MFLIFRRVTLGFRFSIKCDQIVQAYRRAANEVRDLRRHRQLHYERHQRPSRLGGGRDQPAADPPGQLVRGDIGDDRVIGASSKDYGTSGHRHFIDVKGALGRRARSAENKRGGVRCGGHRNLPPAKRQGG